MIARLLLAAGANANAANRYGVTPLSLAAGNASGEMVEVLLKAGADAKAIIRDGETVLMAAARTGNPKAVQSARSKAARSSNAREQIAWARPRSCGRPPKIIPTPRSC